MNHVQCIVDIGAVTEGHRYSSVEAVDVPQPEVMRAPVVANKMAERRGKGTNTSCFRWVTRMGSSNGKVFREISFAHFIKKGVRHIVFLNAVFLAFRSSNVKVLLGSCYGSIVHPPFILLI